MMKLAKTCLVAAAVGGAAFSAMAEETELIVLDMKIERGSSELGKPCISVRSGEEGVYKKVTEYIYPTDFDLQVEGTNGVYSWAVEPQCFTMREVGLIVEATPVIADGMVDLKLKVSIVDEPVWKDYGCTPTAPDGTKKKLSMEQPFFKTKVIENRLLLRPDVSTTFLSDGVAITVTPQIVNAAQIAADAARSAEIVQRMKAMRLPGVAFKPPATIIDAVDFFRQASKDFDSPKIPVEKRGFNFALQTSGSAGAPVVPRIAASDISLYDALKLVCEIVGYKFDVSGGIVIIQPREVKP